MSDILPYVDINNRILTDSTGAAFTLPGLVTADVLNIGLSFLAHTADGVRVIDNFPVRSVRASIGPLYAPPTSGGATLRFGPAPTDSETGAAVAFNATADALKTALTGVTDAWTPAEVVSSDVLLAGPLHQQDSALPSASGREIRSPRAPLPACGPSNSTACWWQEIRFLQAPLAYSTLRHDRAARADFAEVRIGGSTHPDVVMNELQSLTLPGNFVGSYVPGFAWTATNLLGPTGRRRHHRAGAQRHVVGRHSRFSLTNPLPNVAYVEFIGPLGNAPQDLLTITVRAHPPGPAECQS